MARNLYDAFNLINQQKQRRTMEHRIDDGDNGAELLAALSGLGATRVPRSALAYQPEDSTVQRWYDMSRSGTHPTEGLPDFGAPNSPTVQPGVNMPIGRQAGASGAPDAASDPPQSDLPSLTPPPTLEDEPDPARYKRRKWKDVVFGIATSIANSGEAGRSLPGFLGAIAGGAFGGGVMSPRKVTNAQGKSEELGAYGQYLYGQDVGETRQRNEYRQKTYEQRSKAEDRIFDNRLKAANTKVQTENALSLRQAREANMKLGAKREERIERQAGESLALRRGSAEHKKAMDAANLQLKKSKVNTKRVKHPELGYSVLAKVNPAGEVQGYVSDAQGRILEAPEVTFEMARIESERDLAEAGVQQPDVSAIRQQAVEMMKETYGGEFDSLKKIYEDEDARQAYRDIVQSLVTGAAGQYKKKVKEARGSVPSPPRARQLRGSGGGGAPAARPVVKKRSEFLNRLKAVGGTPR